MRVVHSKKMQSGLIKAWECHAEKTVCTFRGLDIYWEANMQTGDSSTLRQLPKQGSHGVGQEGRNQRSHFQGGRETFWRMKFNDAWGRSRGDFPAKAIGPKHFRAVSQLLRAEEWSGVRGGWMRLIPCVLKVISNTGFVCLFSPLLLWAHLVWLQINELPSFSIQGLIRQ